MDIEDQTLSISGGFKEIHSMSSILARLDKHFKGYLPYIFPVVIYDEGEGSLGFLLSEHHPAVDRSIRDVHYINGKEGQIERILFVCGLPSDVVSDELGKFFLEFGGVEKCEIAVDKLMGERRADFGLIVFSLNEVNAQASKGRSPFGGNKVVVRKAKILNLSLDKVSPGASAADGAFTCRACEMVDPWLQPDCTGPEYCQAFLAPDVAEDSALGKEKLAFPLPDGAGKLTEDDSVEASYRARMNRLKWMNVDIPRNWVKPTETPLPKSKLFRIQGFFSRDALESPARSTFRSRARNGFF